MSTENKNLYYLHELSDYKVATNYADVRGWEVLDGGRRVIGKVDGLLVNKHAERVVYLDVEVDEAIVKEGMDTFKLPASYGIHGFLNKEGEDHIIIPIGMVYIDEKEEKVITTGIDYHTFLKTRRFNKSMDITRTYEDEVFNNYVPDATPESLPQGDDFYTRKEFH